MIITHCKLREFKKRHKNKTCYIFIAWEDLKIGTKSGQSLYGNCDDMIVMNCIRWKDDIHKVYLTDRI